MNKTCNQVAEPESLLTEVEAARFLNLTTRALQQWRARGTGPAFVRISHCCIRYRRRDLDAFIESRIKTSSIGQSGSFAPLVGGVA